MWNFRDYLIKKGMVSTRALDLKFAFERMHSALCHLDKGQRAQFWQIVNEVGGMDELIRKYAELEELNQNIK